jgi:GNAT superfamily N-acetyltransferase
MPQVVPFALAGDPAEFMPQIDEIFFESAIRKDFASPEARAAFHELWLGRYLRNCPADCFVAFDDGAYVAGYLAGALVSNADPLPGPDVYALFSPKLVKAYPAHIHVNVRRDCRGEGVGALLIAAFAHHCRLWRVRGFHAITAAKSRPANFFQRCGMENVAESEWNRKPVVMLAQRVSQL